MLNIPLQAVPSQIVGVTLGDQKCIINVYQRYYGIFLDLSSTTSLAPPASIVTGAYCENLNRLVRSDYLGFDGDLAFIDTQGNSSPVYPGLGTQYLLFYLTADDISVEQALYAEVVETFAGIPT